MIATPKPRPVGTVVGDAPAPKFYVQRQVPVFTTHTLPGKPLRGENGQPVAGPDGKLLRGDPLVIDDRTLTAIGENCQRRELSENFPTVCVQHTSRPGEAPTDPEVIGHAENFQLLRLYGKLTIVCDFYIFVEDWAKRQKHPRVSSELWHVGPDPSTWYLDPIAVLGAETPMLDMGIRYSKSKAGDDDPRRYSLIMPAASNVGGLPGGKSPQRYEKDQGMPLDPAERQQLVAELTRAVLSTEPMQWVLGKMQSEGGQNAQPGGAQTADPAGTASPGGADPNAPPGAAPDPSAPPTADGTPPVAPVAGATPLPGDNDDDQETKERFSRLTRYMSENDRSGGMGFLEGMGDDGRERLNKSRAMNSHVRQFYSLQEPAPPVPAGAPTGGPAPMTTPTNGIPTQYAKRIDDLEELVKSQASQLAAATSQLQAITLEKQQSTRYSRVKNWRDNEHILIPSIENELKIIENMTDAQLDAYERDVVRTRYAKSPTGVRLPWVPPTETPSVQSPGQQDAIAAEAGRILRTPEGAGKPWEELCAMAKTKLNLS